MIVTIFILIIIYVKHLPLLLFMGVQFSLFIWRFIGMTEGVGRERKLKKKLFLNPFPEPRIRGAKF